MGKWEYRVVDLIKEIVRKSNRAKEMGKRWLRASDIENILNKLGAQSWELVDIDFFLEKGETVVVAIFKRPV